MVIINLIPPISKVQDRRFLFYDCYLLHLQPLKSNLHVANSYGSTTYLSK